MKHSIKQLPKPGETVSHVEIYDCDHFTSAEIVFSCGRSVRVDLGDYREAAGQGAANINGIPVSQAAAGYPWNTTPRGDK